MFRIIIVINFLIENVKITDTQDSVPSLSIQNPLVLIILAKITSIPIFKPLSRNTYEFWMIFNANGFQFE